MTTTRPRRRITLQSRHIAFAEDRTFIKQVISLGDHLYKVQMLGAGKSTRSRTDTYGDEVDGAPQQRR